MEIRFKPFYERTAKVVHTNGLSRKVLNLGSINVLSERRRPFIQMCFREGVEISFKQGYERTLKSVYTNMLLRKVWKFGSNKTMRERRSPFIQTCFREKCGN